MSSIKLAVGTTVERRIDEEWFRAVVIDSDAAEGTCDIEYSEDHNIEYEVPATEVRVATADTSAEATQVEKKPLVNDESSDAVPVATLHGDSDDANTFVVNGASTKLGAGAGLQGIRFLRQTVNMH